MGYVVYNTSVGACLDQGCGFLACCRISPGAAPGAPVETSSSYRSPLPPVSMELLFRVWAWLLRIDLTPHDVTQEDRAFEIAWQTFISSETPWSEFVASEQEELLSTGNAFVQTEILDVVRQARESQRLIATSLRSSSGVDGLHMKDPTIFHTVLDAFVRKEHVRGKL